MSREPVKVVAGVWRPICSTCYGRTEADPPDSRLTLGGTELWRKGQAEPQFGDNAPTSGNRVENLGWFSSAMISNSMDTDDLGQFGTNTGLVYTGSVGFIAINEEDSLVIRLTGYIDPNNRMKYSDGTAGDYDGWGLESVEYAYDIPNPANDGQNGVEFGIVPSTLPQGASFNNNLFTWTPNFIQGDGRTDNSLRNGWYFVDANISDGSTTSQASNGTLDSTWITAPTTTRVGRGKGELRDSLYVVYFSASDDGIPPSTGVDSLFIMVNDSIENPPPIITQRIILDSADTEVTFLQNSMAFTPDSVLTYREGDSIVVTYWATDQDSSRGETNDALTFLIEGSGWRNFLNRTTSHADSLALDTTSIMVGGTPRAFRVRLNLAYNVGDTATSMGDQVADTLVVRVTDGTTIVYDSMLFRVLNVNRPPIWDQDTSSRPSDSALVWSLDPAAVEPDSVEAFDPIAVANGETDSVYFQQWVYDPDAAIGDNLGPIISIYQSGAPADLFSTTGLMILSISVADTISYPFSITAVDNDAFDMDSATVALNLRVAPEPDVKRIWPTSAAPGETITIFGSGFGLYDENASPPSRVRFRARNAAGQAQNLVATINSWSRDRINLTVPFNTPSSRIDSTTTEPIPDTVEVNSAVFTFPTYYPLIINEADSTKLTEIEVANLTPTSATIKWKTEYTGVDSVILALNEDTLDIFSTNFAAPSPPSGPGGYWPTFVVQDVPGPGLTSIKSSVTRYVGATSVTDQIHSVTLTDLNPGTTYRFIVGLENNLFYGDSSYNENGPWRPAKIDRSNSASGSNGLISGFRLRTPPAQGSNGETYEIYGKVFTESGAATNALVTVKIVDYQNVADTSLPLVTTVSTDSTWQINLGGALTDTTGVTNRVFPHKQGDYLVLIVRADGDEGFTQFVTTRGASGDSPQEIRTTDAGILLTPSVTYDIYQKLGLNLIGLPVDPLVTEIKTAEDLLNELAGGKPSITRYVSTTGEQETIIRTISASGRQFVGADNWDLALYDAYFVAISSAQYLNIEGTVFGDTLPVKVFPGAAMYWISRPAQKSSLFYAWSARTMLTNIANAIEIFRFNEDQQNYESAILVGTAPDQQFIGDDFHIDVSEGYILKVTAASQWDIDIPTTTLLANADEKLNGDPANTPAITLNTSKVLTGSAAVRAIRLTNVTSSAASISWVTDGTGEALVRYGKAEEGLNQVAYFSKDQLADGMRMVQLLNLEPETAYLYEVVSDGVTYNDNGQPFTLLTAKIGIGQPYTVFGRVIDQDGNPLARTLVYLEAKRGENRSTPLAAITDDRGYWNANLANLKSAEGLVYNWNVGDELRVTAIHKNTSLTFRTLVSGESPQNVVKVKDPTTETASKKEVSRVSLPKSFALGQNFPNPFNPSTTIAFDIPENREEGVDVQLNIYNIRGQLVRSLVNEVKTPGHYSVQWNGMNEKGDVVSSGVYFYRIKAGDYTATRKMVLLK